MRYRRLLYTLKHKSFPTRRESPDIRIHLPGSLKRGSFTIEAAAVLPVFLFGMIAMISFMDLYRQETVHLMQTCQEAELQGLEQACAGNMQEELVISDTYEYRPLSLLIPLAPVERKNEARVHLWNGRPSGSHFGDGNLQETEPMVYITATGNVIHKSLNCSYLNLSVSMVSGADLVTLANHSGGHYHACETCSRNESPAAVVFITEYGSSYHNHSTCSTLKRTVRLVKESEAEGYHLCSRCAGGG